MTSVSYRVGLTVSSDAVKTLESAAPTHAVFEGLCKCARLDIFRQQGKLKSQYRIKAVISEEGMNVITENTGTTDPLARVCRKIEEAAEPATGPVVEKFIERKNTQKHAFGPYRETWDGFELATMSKTIVNL